jgi:transposase-like protein
MAASDRKNPKRVKSSQSLYSLHEFLREFPDDESCLEWLWRERHSEDGEHAHCPKCEKLTRFRRYATRQQRQSWTCTACGHHVHPTAGTIFAKSSRPLTDWFYVMYLVSSSRCGVAAKQVERELGCNYRTAWRMLNKVRNELMCQDDEKPVSGEVEFDETFMGGGLRNKDRRKAAAERPEGKRVYAKRQRPVVVAAVERKGRIRATVVDDSRPSTLLPLVAEYVLPGSLIFTDEYWVYERLDTKVYGHKRIRHKERVYVEGDVHTQTADGFFGHFKTDIRGTHHSISRKWLLGYLNEWVWKWNRRDDDEAMFRQLLRSAATG